MPETIHHPTSDNDLQTNEMQSQPNPKAPPKTNHDIETNFRAGEEERSAREENRLRAIGEIHDYLKSGSKNENPDNGQAVREDTSSEQSQPSQTTPPRNRFEAQLSETTRKFLESSRKARIQEDMRKTVTTKKETLTSRIGNWFRSFIS